MQLIQFHRLRLSTQFLIASFPVIGLCTILIGSWIGSEVKIGLANRLGSEAALYVEGYISKRLEFVPGGKELTAQSIQSLDLILVNTALGKKVNALHIWGPGGKLIYCKNRSLIGKSFPIEVGLEEAYSGNIFTEIIKPFQYGLHSELLRWDTLINAFVPIRHEETEDVMAVAEFFLMTGELEREARSA